MRESFLFFFLLSSPCKNISKKSLRHLFFATLEVLQAKEKRTDVVVDEACQYNIEDLFIIHSPCMVVLLNKNDSFVTIN